VVIHDGSNDKSLGPVSQGTGSPIFHTRGATGNWTGGILEKFRLLRYLSK
jgi:hypothetical protein